ncbi:acetate--CoA ligase family protein [Hyphococcus luteus]|nr:acetate--CoA ligase family protein [Marinicaulis flavus]
MSVSGSAPRFDLRRLLNPSSVAIAGASPDPKSIGGAVLGNVQASGFDGALTLVSPRRDEINGRPCVKSLRDIPEGTDAVILNIPHAAIRQALEDCAARKVGGAVVFASGFGETGEAGRAEQEAISALCRENGLALIGPNCLGFINYADGFSATFEGQSFDTMSAKGARRVAVIAQSGATATSVRDAFRARGLSISHMITTGNEAVLHAADFVSYVIEEGVAAVALYIEQIRDPQAFLAAARRAREKGVPIIMLHPGRSARAREAAQSHTGALTGDYAMMKTAVEKEAVVLVETMDELLDATVILQRFPKSPFGDAAIVTNSGAIRGLSLDMIEDVGLPLATPSAATLELFKSLVPAGMEIDLPLDLGTAGYSNAGVYTDTAAALLADDNAASILYAMIGGGPHQQRAKAEALAPVMKGTDKPVVLTITGDQSALDDEFKTIVRDNEIPLFRSLDRSIRAMAAVHGFAKAREAAEGRRAAPEGLPLLKGAGAVSEYDGKAWLKKLGVPVPKGGLVSSVNDACAKASEIGYPIVIKAHGSTLMHKSDIGGVIVGVKDEAELKAAWDRLHANIAEASKTAELEGVLLEQMSKPGLEMVVGAKRDPEWGPVVLAGLGGVWIEALKAVEIMPPDITHKQAVERICAMQGASLLKAFRGQPARDVNALAEIVVLLGDAMRADPSITEVDINPVMLFADGEGAMALDALIVKGK